jgi:hypothetical protein
MAGGIGLIVNKTWPEYIAMRVLIIFMRDLPWLCLLYWFVVFALGGITAISHPVSIVIEVIGAIEILFYLFFFLPYKYYLDSRPPYKPPPMTRTQRAALIYKSLDLVPDMQTFLRKWMMNAHLEDIRRDNVKDWLLWALFEQDSKDGIRPDVDSELDQYLQEAENRIGVKLSPGRGDSEAIRLPIDPVLIQHRTLLFYTVFFILPSQLLIDKQY